LAACHSPFESNPFLYQRRGFSRYGALARAEEGEIVTFATGRYSMIRVYDESDCVIQTHEHEGEFKEW
jgi:hypothetical protein